MASKNSNYESAGRTGSISEISPPYAPFITGGLGTTAIAIFLPQAPDAAVHERGHGTLTTGSTMSVFLRRQHDSFFATAVRQWDATTARQRGASRQGAHRRTAVRRTGVTAFRRRRQAG